MGLPKERLAIPSEHELISSPLLVNAVVDRSNNAIVLADTGCNTMGIVTATFTKQNTLTRVQLQSQTITTYDNKPAESVSALVYVEVNIAGVKSPCWLYEVSHMPDQDIILGLPWMRAQNAAIHTRKGRIEFESHGSSTHQCLPEADICQISANSFGSMYNRSKQ